MWMSRVHKPFTLSCHNSLLEENDPSPTMAQNLPTGAGCDEGEYCLKKREPRSSVILRYKAPMEFTWEVLSSLLSCLSNILELVKAVHYYVAVTGSHAAAPMNKDQHAKIPLSDVL